MGIERVEGSVSLQDLFDGDVAFPWDPNDGFTPDDVAFLLCRGGWPISVLAPRDIAIEITKNYYNGLFVFEDCENERFRNKRPEVLKMILRSYARHISTEAAASTIIADVRQRNERTMDVKTFGDYMEALNDLYILEDLPAWNPDIRPKTSIRSTPTRHFVDTSIACRVLGIGPDDLKRDLESFGLFFGIWPSETLLSMLGHWAETFPITATMPVWSVTQCCNLRTADGGAIEIKLGGAELVAAGAKSLKSLLDKITGKNDEKATSFLMVLTAIGGAYRRENGVYVSPVNLLKP